MSELKQKVFQYLQTNPVNDKQIDKYDQLRLSFGITSKQASEYWNDYKQKNWQNIKWPENPNNQETITSTPTQPFQGKNQKDYTSDTLNVSMDTDVEVKTLEELLYVCDVNTKEWEVLTWQCKKWDLGIKNDQNKIETKQLFSVSAKFKRRVLDSDLRLQKEVILKELLNEAPKFRQQAQKKNKGIYAYEISLPDIHIGKFSWADESGEDYDLKIAEDRYNAAIDHFISLVRSESIERIILPIGNDMINIDSRKGETTAGTRVDSDTRFYKIVRTVKDLLISNINILSAIAPVDVVVVAGNHDYETMFMIGEMLSCYFHKSENVTIDNSPKQRKYYQYGNNGFMYTHGNEEKHGDLGLIFATENPSLWYESIACRHIKLGHYHKNKKLTFTNVDENTGFTVQILPSLSGTDFWHNSKGYFSKKSAKGFLYSKESGLVAEYNYNL